MKNERNEKRIEDKKTTKRELKMIMTQKNTRKHNGRKENQKQTGFAFCNMLNTLCSLMIEGCLIKSIG